MADVYSVEAKLTVDTGTFYDEIEQAGEAMDNAAEQAGSMADSYDQLAAAMIENGGVASEDVGKLADLSAQLEESEQRQGNLEDAIHDAIQAEGEESETVQQLRDAYAEEVANAADLQYQIDSLTGVVQENTAAQNENADAAEEAGSTASGEATSLESAFGQVTSFIKTAKTAVEGLVAVKAAEWVWNLTDSVASLGDSIDKSSQKMGVSADFYQRWEYVAQHCGTSMSSLKTSMKTLSSAVESGNSAFEDLGLSLDDISNMSVEEQFEAVVAALQDCEDVTQRTYDASQLLGRGATEMGAIFNMTSDDTEALKGTIDSLNGIMSDDMVAASAKYEDALYDLQVASQGAKNAVAEAFVGINTEAIELATFVITEFTDSLIGEQNVADDFWNSDAVDRYFANAQAGAEGTAEAVSGVSDATAEMAASSEASLSELAEAYAETYASVQETVQGFFGTFDAAEETQAASMDEMISNLQSQQQWNADYADSLETIRSSGYGLEDVASAIADMGEGGAEYAAALKDAINAGDTEKINELKTAFEGVQSTQDLLTDAIAQTSSSFDDLAAAAEGDISRINTALNGLDGKTVTTYIIANVVNSNDSNSVSIPKSAGGIDEVPYNDYLVMLHQGERVLTKEEVQRENESPKNSGIQITQNIQSVAMSPVQLAAATQAYFEQARWTM